MRREGPLAIKRSATPLDRLLRSGEARSITALDALHLAKREFLAGRHIDMGNLADELGVNRVTLYRWVGNRERLLVEVIWHLTQQTFKKAAGQARVKGGPRVAFILSRFITGVISNAGMQAWLKREGESAMRLLTLREGDFQPRLVDAIQQLLEDEMKAGQLVLPIPAEEFGFMLARLAESYVYRRYITGDESDGTSAEALLLHLLR